MKAEVQPLAGTEQILHLLIALGTTEVCVKINKYEFRHAKTECPRHLTAYKFGYKRFFAVSGSAKFHHILKVPSISQVALGCVVAGFTCSASMSFLHSAI